MNRYGEDTDQIGVGIVEKVLHDGTKFDLWFCPPKGANFKITKRQALKYIVPRHLCRYAFPAHYITKVRQVETKDKNVENEVALSTQYISQFPMFSKFSSSKWENSGFWFAQCKTAKKMQKGIKLRCEHFSKQRLQREKDYKHKEKDLESKAISVHHHWWNW